MYKIKEDATIDQIWRRAQSLKKGREERIYGTDGYVHEISSCTITEDAIYPRLTTYPSRYTFEHQLTNIYCPNES